MSKPRLVIAPSLPPDVLQRARERFDCTGGAANLSAEQAVDQAVERQAQALLVSHRHRMMAELVQRLPNTIRALATVTVGHDHIDTATAKARGFIVTNTPDVLTDCTADMTLLLILAASRRASEAEQIMRKGWRQSFGMGDFLGRSVSGKRLGILGMGRIGRAVAQRARGFDMKILYCNRSRLPPELEQGARYFSEPEAMLPECDILSVNAPSTPETAKIIDARRLALLPDGAIFVNTSRGQLADEEALLAALKSGKLFAAGLDVFASEPDFDLRFAELPNVFLAPHIGSATVETRNAMGFRALDNIAAVCGGRPAIDPV